MGRPTIAEIDLDALRHNFFQLKAMVGPSVKMLAVVKANAYGHGAVPVARELSQLGIDFLGVACCEEGVTLRQAGIDVPIIILGGIFPDQIEEILRLDCIPVLFDPHIASLLGKAAEKIRRDVKVHLKLDTGMGRVGSLPEQIVEFLTLLREYPSIRLDGLLSHYAESEVEDDSFTRLQMERFQEAARLIASQGFSPSYHHISNSAALVNGSLEGNLARPGIMFYGAYPHQRFREKIDLRPVMRLKTAILHVKEVPVGTPISYGRTFVTRRDSIIATLPIGYADGFRRILSNKGMVLFRGKRLPVVGRVCMDHTMIDVTDAGGAEVGEEVVIIGSQGEERISAEEVAGWSGTISYEVFCAVGERVPRGVITSGDRTQ